MNITTLPEEEYRAFFKRNEEQNIVRCPLCNRVLMDLRLVHNKIILVGRCQSCKKLIRVIAEE